VNIAKSLTAKEAAAYVGCRTMATFHAWVRKGILPPAIPGTHSYSREAIDESLRCRAGLQSAVEALDPYEAWARRRNR
jgi:hypothetical protein